MCQACNHLCCDGRNLAGCGCNDCPNARCHSGPADEDERKPDPEGDNALASALDRFNRLIDALYRNPRGTVDVFDATGIEGAENGFALKIGGDFHIFTYSEGEVLVGILKPLDDPVSSELCRIMAAMIERKSP